MTPMVNESSPSAVRRFDVTRNGDVVRQASFPSGRLRSQYGFRSRGAAYDDLLTTGVFNARQWKDAYRIVQVADLEYGRHLGSSDAVNTRRYSEIRYHPGPVTETLAYTIGGRRYVDTFSGGFAVLPNGSWAPPLTSDEDVKRIGSDLMRRSVPTAPEVDLLRFAGELRDAGAFIDPNNYVPQQVSHLGGGYLNIIFGVVPTISDLMKITEMVESSSRVLKDYVSHEKRLIRRSRTRLVNQRSGSSTLSGYPYNGGSVAMSVDGSVACYAVGDGPSGVNWGTSTFVDVDYRERIRSFASFEYFIPRPSGIVGRFDHYRAKAQRLLGVEFNSSVAYDLTRWSWLVDWFVDIGGLLRYQEAVAGNNVVSSRTGASRLTDFSVTARVQPAGDQVPANYRPGSQIIRGSATAVQKTVWRDPGGPYSILQPWDLSGSQAAIVGALGVSRLPAMG